MAGTAKNKLLTLQQLAKALKPLKKSKKIVFTNGCFDLLHAGHLSVFEKAKNLGDILIVGLNSDRSVKAIKGPQRPIVDEKNRAKLIAGFACVDYIVIFNEPTPAQTIRKLKPNILVKGGDWKEGSIIGWEDVDQVVRIPMIRGLSTTRIIENVLNAYRPA